MGDDPSGWYLGYGTGLREEGLTYRKGGRVFFFLPYVVGDVGEVGAAAYGVSHPETRAPLL